MIPATTIATPNIFNGANRTPKHRTGSTRMAQQSSNPTATLPYRCRALLPCFLRCTARWSCRSPQRAVPMERTTARLSFCPSSSKILMRSRRWGRWRMANTLIYPNLFVDILGTKANAIRAPNVHKLPRTDIYQPRYHSKLIPNQLWTRWFGHICPRLQNG